MKPEWCPQRWDKTRLLMLGRLYAAAIRAKMEEQP